VIPSLLEVVKMSSTTSECSVFTPTFAEESVSSDESHLSDMDYVDDDEELNENGLSRTISVLSDLTRSTAASRVSSSCLSHLSLEGEAKQTLELTEFVTSHSRVCFCLKNLVSPTEWITGDWTKIHDIVKTCRKFAVGSFNSGCSKKGNTRFDHIRALLRG
jgi:hypothetical protein